MFVIAALVLGRCTLIATNTVTYKQELIVYSGGV